MNFDDVQKIAAAILYEGYILYPYRKSAIKNRQRWNFGTLYPRVYAEQQRPQERFRLVTEVLTISEPHPGASLSLRLSFLQLVRQRTSKTGQELTDPSLAWEEAVEHTSDHVSLELRGLLSSPLELTVHLPGASLPEGRCNGPAPDLNATLSIRAERLGSCTCRLHLDVQNTTPLPSGSAASRDEAFSRSFVSAHILLGIEGGEFASLLDPPPDCVAFATACNNCGVFPVLAGEEPDRSRMLCSPIILYDYPKIAPESEGDFFDGTEMDEMLTLRVLTLTDSEKEEMREGDPLARRILERTESLSGGEMLKAHGVVRSLRQLREDVQ